MCFDFQRYLNAKQSVDDRALNRRVWDRLVSLHDPDGRVIEIGCGTGAMARRMLNRGLVRPGASYLGVDIDPENIARARRAAAPQGMAFVQADFFELQPGAAADLLVGAAFLDLVDLETALPALSRFMRPGGLAYFPITFDGVTLFEPRHPADARVLSAYHHSMDARPGGGGSRTGRALCHALPEAGFEILAAGSSDWLVYPGEGGRYPADEAYFLGHILHFFEESCAGAAGLGDWLADRRRQVEGGELVFIAHQLDFLARRTEGRSPGA